MNNVLTELRYAQPSYPMRLYIYGADGFHRGGIWFEKTPRYPDQPGSSINRNETISTSNARMLCDAALAMGNEVRITDGGDMLVFHSQLGVTLYPESSAAFWAAVEGLEDAA